MGKYVCPRCGEQLLVWRYFEEEATYSVDPETGALTEKTDLGKFGCTDVSFYCSNPNCGLDVGDILYFDPEDGDKLVFLDERGEFIKEE